MKQVALFAASLVISLTLADLAFRIYESRLLSLDLSPDGPEVDLGALNFNESRVAKRKAQGEFRVLSIGDSFAYAIAKRAYTYHSVASDLLGVRIVNLGEPAIAVHRYQRAYDHWAPVLEHDAVVFNLYLGNDIQESDRTFRAEDDWLNPVFAGFDYNLETGRKREVNVPSRFPLRLLDYAYAWWRTGGSRAPRNAESVAGGGYNLALVLHDEDWILEHNAKRLDLYRYDRIERWRGGFEAIARFAEGISALRRTGTKVTVLLSPTALQTVPSVRKGVEELRGIDLDDYDLDLPSFLIQELFRRIDPAIPLIDLRPTLACAAEQGETVYHPNNPHWSLEGNRVVGERLARFMAEHWLEGRRAEISWPPCVDRDRALEATPAREEVATRLLDPLVDAR